MRESFEDFIDKLKDGDDYSWNNLVRDYRNKLFAYAYSLSKDKELSLEIVQQVFVKVYIVRKRLNPKLSIKTYMYKSVFNEFINCLNKKKKIYSLHNDYNFGQIHLYENDTTTDEIKVEKIELVNKLIDQLPKKTKKVFVMSKKRGFCNLEISEILKIHPKTVEGHITKAYKLLRSNAKISA
jgi:RNA polymerase sigma-70 factor (ECF subfamily)